VLHFRDMLREYKTKLGYQLKKTINQKKKVGVYCLNSDCIWRIYVSLLYGSKTFMIKSLKSKHICINSSTIKVATSIWIAKKLLPLINDEPNISNKAFKTILNDKFRIKLHPI